MCRRERRCGWERGWEVIGLRDGAGTDDNPRALVLKRLRNWTRSFASGGYLADHAVVQIAREQMDDLAGCAFPIGLAGSEGDRAGGIGDIGPHFDELSGPVHADGDERIAHSLHETHGPLEP